MLSDKRIVGTLAAVEAVIKKELTDAKIERLKQLGFDQVEVYHGHTVVTTAPDRLPEGYNQLRRQIVAEEMFSSVRVTIYADMSGKPLRRFRREEQGDDVCAYGFVAVPLDLTVVRVEAVGKKYGAKHVTISVESADEETFEVERETLWDSEKELRQEELTAALPIKLQKYKKAVVAAMKKMDGNKCRRLYFY